MTIIFSGQIESSEHTLNVIYQFHLVTRSCNIFQKPCGLFEIAEVVPVMTNNYEESILKGVKVGCSKSLTILYFKGVRNMLIDLCFSRFDLQMS